jgi:hypothetical protein
MAAADFDVPVIPIFGQGKLFIRHHRQRPSGARIQKPRRGKIALFADAPLGSDLDGPRDGSRRNLGIVGQLRDIDGKQFRLATSRKPIAVARLLGCAPTRGARAVFLLP